MWQTGGMHVHSYKVRPDMRFVHNNGDDDEVPLTVSVYPALGNRAAVFMCMAAGDSCGSRISTNGGDMSCFLTICA